VFDGVTHGAVQRPLLATAPLLPHLPPSIPSTPVSHMRLHEVSTNVSYASFQIFHAPLCRIPDALLPSTPRKLRASKPSWRLPKCTAHLTALRWNKQLQGKMGCQFIQAWTHLTMVRLIRMRKAYLAWRLGVGWSATFGSCSVQLGRTGWENGFMYTLLTKLRRCRHRARENSRR